MATPERPDIPPVPESKLGFNIISAPTVAELAEKVSAALEDGSRHLHGGPFVFNQEVCQAVKSATCG